MRFSVNVRVIRHVLLGLLALASVCVAASAPGAEPPPIPREFRGAWVATVKNIDWPSKPNLTSQQQQGELIAILDKCQALNLNTVIFQVRPACDALYASKVEPWSEYLTGTQGKAPSPFWDPLEFAVQQAHARGIELHAWFNPFRARHTSGFSALAPGHISNTRPALVKPYGAQRWLDPGLQEVHDHSMRVILDVVTRYDIDGIHLDDYFYPYPEKDAAGKEIPFPDWTSWLQYQKSGGKLAKADWRRDNVNRFVARLYREVKAAKPWVKVGVSPFGIYRPGFPSQIRGFDQYESLYADPRKWLGEGWVDYLAPQLYWRIDAPAQSFPVLLKWWSENNPRHRTIVAGMNTFNAGTGSSAWPASEILSQVQATRHQPGAQGHVHWNMSALMRNKGGVTDMLAREAYRETALAPGLSGAAARPAPASRIIVTNTGAAALCRWESSAQDVRAWVLQVRRDGKWQTKILPGHNTSYELNSSSQEVAISAVDRFGNQSEPKTWVRAMQ